MDFWSDSVCLHQEYWWRVRRRRGANSRVALTWGKSEAVCNLAMAWKSILWRKFQGLLLSPPPLKKWKRPAACYGTGHAIGGQDRLIKARRLALVLLVQREAAGWVKIVRGAKRRPHNDRKEEVGRGWEGLRVPAVEFCSLLPVGQVGLITERVKVGVLLTCQQLTADAFYAFFFTPPQAPKQTVWTTTVEAECINK